MRRPPRTRHVRDAVESAETNGYLKGHQEAWWNGYAQALLDFPQGIATADAEADLDARIAAGPTVQRGPSGRGQRRYAARRTSTGHVLQLVSSTLEQEPK